MLGQNEFPKITSIILTKSTFSSGSDLSCYTTEYMSGKPFISSIHKKEDMFIDPLFLETLLMGLSPRDTKILGLFEINSCTFFHLKFHFLLLKIYI